MEVLGKEKLGAVVDMDMGMVPVSGFRDRDVDADQVRGHERLQGRNAIWGGNGPVSGDSFSGWRRNG